MQLYFNPVIFRIIGQEKRTAEWINQLPFGKMTWVLLKQRFNKST